jgi:hypothetical protein
MFTNNYSTLQVSQLVLTQIYLNGDGIINGSDRYIYNGDPDGAIRDLHLPVTTIHLPFNLRANIGNRVLTHV